PGMTIKSHSEGEARKNPADSLKSWIASHTLAMTTLLQDYLIPAPCGRGSKGVGVNFGHLDNVPFEIPLAKAAFTLAEVLITLGIIGIVAAMTIPSLMASYQKNQTVVRLKKSFADLQNIVKMSEAENDDMSGWNFPSGYNNISECETFVKTYYLPYVRGARYLDSTQKAMRTYEIKNLNGRIVGYPACGVELSDGRFFSFFLNTGGKYIWLFMDINGFQGPNRVGRDIFILEAYNFPAQSVYSIKFWGNYSNTIEHLQNSGAELTDNNNASGYGCSKNNKNGHYAGWYCGEIIRRNGWKIPKDYPW
ncbi:MAG: type II secretion system GspH family protein, partial [Muribaculaceae bacterium]|nr:type II secretion system GspH family protein [Muribaculaceae bacterium]